MGKGNGECNEIHVILLHGISEVLIYIRKTLLVFIDVSVLSRLMKRLNLITHGVNNQY